MTTMQRIRSIRLMEKMNAAYSNNNTNVEISKDGTIEYKNDDGLVLIEAKMKG